MSNHDNLRDYSLNLKRQLGPDKLFSSQIGEKANHNWKTAHYTLAIAFFVNALVDLGFGPFQRVKCLLLCRANDLYFVVLILLSMAHNLHQDKN